MHGRGFVEALPTNGAEFAFILRRLRPAMRDRVLDDAGGYTGAGGHHRCNTALVHDEVAHCREKEKLVLNLFRFFPVNNVGAC